MLRFKYMGIHYVFVVRLRTQPHCKVQEGRKSAIRIVGRIKTQPARLKAHVDLTVFVQTSLHSKSFSLVLNAHHISEESRANNFSMNAITFNLSLQPV